MWNLESTLNDLGQFFKKLYQTFKTSLMGNAITNLIINPSSVLLVGRFTYAFLVLVIFIIFPVNVLSTDSFESEIQVVYINYFERLNLFEEIVVVLPIFIVTEFLLFLFTKLLFFKDSLKYVYRTNARYCVYSFLIFFILWYTLIITIKTILSDNDSKANNIVFSIFFFIALCFPYLLAVIFAINVIRNKLLRGIVNKLKFLSTILLVFITLITSLFVGYYSKVVYNKHIGKFTMHVSAPGNSNTIYIDTLTTLEQTNFIIKDKIIEHIFFDFKSIDTNAFTVVKTELQFRNNNYTEMIIDKKKFIITLEDRRKGIVFYLNCLNDSITESDYIMIEPNKSKILKLVGLIDRNQLKTKLQFDSFGPNFILRAEFLPSLNDETNEIKQQVQLAMSFR